MNQDAIPFHTFLWKVASRCNLDCSYCYVYHSADQRWRLQPGLMSEAVARQTAARMREHLAAHGKTDAAINFHGGEPLLGGIGHLRMLLGVIEEELAGVSLSFAMQTNGLLLTPEVCDFLLVKRFRVGVSLDGPPEVNDRYRVDHQGRPTSALLEEKLALLSSDPYRDIRTTLLCVIDPTTDPVAVSDYLLSFSPTSVDFLYPLDNHDRLPSGKEAGCRGSAPYGEWLIRAFDHWWKLGRPVRNRIFNSILVLLCGGHSPVESLGLSPVDLVVVETNGEIEGVDSLKSTFEGATALGFNVFEHGFDPVAGHVAVQQRQVGLSALCDACRQCPVVEVCGGGYLPHRYSQRNGFDNPSVYCLDLEILIRHIHATLRASLEKEGGLASVLLRQEPEISEVSS